MVFSSNLVLRFAATWLVFMLACMPLGSAMAASYVILMDNSVAEINVPDDWNPNSSDLGLDASSPDNTLFFSIYVSTDSEEKAALREAITTAENGGVLQIDMGSLNAATVDIGSISTHEYGYDTMMNGAPGYLAINLVELNTGGYLQIIRWGTRKSFVANSADAGQIFDSLKLIKY